MAYPYATDQVFSFTTSNSLYDEYNDYIQNSSLILGPTNNKSNPDIAYYYTPKNRPTIDIVVKDKFGNIIGDSIKVEDADTFYIYKDGLQVDDVRINNIDAREVTHDKDDLGDLYGAWQSYVGAKLVQYSADNDNSLIIDRSAKDHFNRSVANCVFEDKDGNKADYSYILVKNGISDTIARQPKQVSQYQFSDYQKAKIEAQSKGLGIWNPAIRAQWEAQDKKREEIHSSRYKYDFKFNSKRNQMNYNLDDPKYSNKVKIGDVWLDIPPTHLTINQIRTSGMIELVGFESKPVNTPMSRIILKTNLVFSGDRINNDLKRIMTQFRYCPFNLIRSKDLWNKLASSGPLQNKKDNPLVSLLAPYKGTYCVPVTMDEYILYTIEGHPEVIGCSLQFSLFNFMPYFGVEDDAKLEYYLYHEDDVDRNKNTLDSIFRRTVDLENSCHPYNLMIEEELLKNKFKAEFSPSEINIFKVDRSFSQKEVTRKEEFLDRSLTPEEFVDVVKNFKITEIANSISICYKNQFTWQPVLGHANPTAQYIGPGATYVSINVKTDNDKNISKLLKTFHDKVKENEYGFYDDRYLFSSALTNFAGTDVVSISDIVVTSLDGHPGWSDINIQLNKSSFEYDTQYNNASAEFDEYWGLGRIAAAADNPEVNKILVEDTIENNAAVDNTSIVDKFEKITPNVDTANMDHAAKLAINNEFKRFLNASGMSEQELINSFVVMKAKSETMTGDEGLVRQLINNYSDKYLAYVNNKTGEIKYLSDTSNYKEKKLPFPFYTVEHIDESPINKNTILSIIGRASKVLPGAQRWGDYTVEEKIALAKKYMNKSTQYSADGTMLWLRTRYHDKSEELFSKFRSLGLFQSEDFRTITSGVVNGDIYKIDISGVEEQGLTKNDIIIRYTNNQEYVHKIHAEKEKNRFIKLQNELSKVDLSKYIDNIKPWAAHRYFPDIDRFVYNSPILSVTVGEWYYSNRFKQLSSILNTLQYEAANSVCPTQDYEAWISVYMQEQYPKLYKKIIDNDSPMSIIEAVTYPISKREIDIDTNKKLIKDGKLLDTSVTFASTNVSNNGDKYNYPYNTWQPNIMQTGFGTTLDLNKQGSEYTTKLYEQAENFRNNTINVVTYQPKNTKYTDRNDIAIKNMYDISNQSLLLLDGNNSAYKPSARTIRDSAPYLLAAGTPKSITDPYESGLSTLNVNFDRVGARKNLGMFINYLAKTGKINKNQTPAAMNEKTSSSTNNRQSEKTFQELNNANNPYVQEESRKLTKDFLAGILPTQAMENAFPTYKLYIISEDTSEVRYFSLDDYYDYRLLQDFMVIKDKNNPVSILKARLIVDPRYITTNPWFNPDAVRSGNAEFDISYIADLSTVDTKKAKFWAGGRTPLREGMRICLRAGYHTDPRLLDIIFIGTIVSLNGRSEIGVYDIECHGDGRELTIPATTTSKLFKGDNFASIISQILRANTNIIHFGRVYGSFLERFSRKHYQLIQLCRNAKIPAGLIGGVLGVGTTAYTIGLKEMARLTLGSAGLKYKIPVMVGIAAFFMGRNVIETIGQELGRKWTQFKFKSNSDLSARLSDLQGWLQGSTFNAFKAEQQVSQIINDTFMGDNNPVDDNIYAVDIWNSSTLSKFELNINQRKSVWDVLQTIRRMYPGWALDIRPYGNRSTLFLGSPSFDYWRTDDPVEAMAPALEYKSNNYKLNEAQYLALKKYSTKVGSNYRVDPDDANTIAPRVIFQKSHIATSYDNIVVNSIRSTPYRGWNTVNVNYSLDAAKNNAGESDIVTVSADSDLDPGAISIKYENADFTDDEQLATFYALGILKEGVERLYGGTLVVRGNPKIDPYDKIYIYDDISKMYGWVQVETVIHKFDSEMGFTTHIVPNMMCDINSDAYISQSQIAKAYLYQHLGKSLLTSGVSFGATVLVNALFPGVGALLTAGIAIGASTIAGYVYDKVQHQDDNSEISKETRPETNYVTDYMHQAIQLQWNMQAAKWGLYVNMIKESFKQYNTYKNDIGKVSKTYVPIIDRIFNVTKRTFNKASTLFSSISEEIKVGGTILKGAAAEKKLLSVAAEMGKKKGLTAITAAEDATVSAIEKGSTFVKYAKAPMKMFWATEIIGMFAELAPAYLDGMAVKYAKKNNTIIIHPIWHRGKLLMQGLEGYRNNDLWMHTRNVMINAKRNLNEACDILTNWYDDVGYSLGEEGNKAIASVVPSSTVKSEPNKIIKNDLFKSLSDDDVVNYIYNSVLNANRNDSGIATRVITALRNENRKYNIPWELIAAIIDIESEFRTRVIGGDGHGIGIMQVDDRYHTRSLENSSGVSLSVIRSNPTNYLESIIKVGMSILNDNYSVAYKFLNQERFSGASNKDQAIYQLTYSYYNGGIDPKKTTVTIPTTFDNTIDVLPQKEITIAALPVFNKCLNKVIGIKNKQQISNFSKTLDNNLLSSASSDSSDLGRT